MLLELQHCVSKEASNEFWKLATKFMPRLYELKQLQQIHRAPQQFPHIRRQLNRTHVPKISLDYGFKNKQTGEIIEVKNLEVDPVSRFPSSTHIKLYEIASIKVSYDIFIN